MDGLRWVYPQPVHFIWGQEGSMVEKGKAPVPDRKQADTKPADTKRSEPQFIRGTIDPPTKKEG